MNNLESISTTVEHIAAGNNLNAELIAGLRDLISFIEANPDFDFGSMGRPVVEMTVRSWYRRDGQDPRALVADLIKRAHGVSKTYGTDFAWFRKEFGQHVRFEISTERATVCERVVTGTKIVPARPAMVLPAEPERVEELVEWHCSPILDAAVDHA